VLELVTLSLTLVARDPRVGLAGVMVAIPNFLTSFATSARGLNHAVTPIYRLGLVSITSLMICLLAIAVAMMTVRRSLHA